MLESKKPRCRHFDLKRSKLCAAGGSETGRPLSVGNLWQQKGVEEQKLKSVAVLKLRKGNFGDVLPPPSPSIRIRKI